MLETIRKISAIQIISGRSVHRRQTWYLWAHYHPQLSKCIIVTTNQQIWETPPEVTFKLDNSVYLEGIFPADVVIHWQHGDVKAGQQDTSQDVVLFVICSNEREHGRLFVYRVMSTFFNLKRLQFSRQFQNWFQIGLCIQKSSKSCYNSFLVC